MAEHSGDFKESMYSRLGRTCNNRIKLADKREHILGEKSAPTFDVHLISVGGKQTAASEMTGLFTFYQHMERERAEALEHEKRLEMWKTEEELLLDPTAARRKKPCPSFLKQTSSFKTCERRPMGYESVCSLWSIRKW